MRSVTLAGDHREHVPRLTHPIDAPFIVDDCDGKIAVRDERDDVADLGAEDDLAGDRPGRRRRASPLDRHDVTARDVADEVLARTRRQGW